jgi:hypothetical protein
MPLYLGERADGLTHEPRDRLYDFRAFDVCRSPLAAASDQGAQEES